MLKKWQTFLVGFVKAWKSFIVVVNDVSEFLNGFGGKRGKEIEKKSKTSETSYWMSIIY